MLNYKNAQVGSTITWIVATLIIVILLSMSIYVTSAIAEGESLFGFLDFSVSNSFSDTLAQKSFLSYLLTENDGKNVYTQIKDEGNLNDFNGPLAQKVFEIYKNEYPEAIWIGLVEKVSRNSFIENSFFGKRPSEKRGIPTENIKIDYVSEKIKLNEDKAIELVLID